MRPAPNQNTIPTSSAERPIKPRCVVAASPTVIASPSTVSPNPISRHRRRTRSGLIVNHPWPLASAYKLSSTFDRRSAKVVRSADNVVSWPSRNRPSNSIRSYGRSPASSASERTSRQSGLPKKPSFGTSWICRNPRTARSTIVALTSSVFACSSISVPTWPGLMPSGGANSTGPSASASPRGTGSDSPEGLPMIWSTCEPRYRRSRPRLQARNPNPAMPTTARPAPPPPRARAGRPPPRRSGHRCDRECPLGTPALVQDRGLHGDRALRDPDDDGEPLVREQMRLREGGGVALERRRITPLARALLSSEARDARDLPRRRHVDGRALDRDAPLVADPVPIELVAFPEAVQRTLDRVRDPVLVRAGDQLVGVADLDLRLPVARIAGAVSHRRSG